MNRGQSVQWGIQGQSGRKSVMASSFILHSLIITFVAQIKNQISNQMKKLFVIATLVGFGFCATAQTTPAAPAQAAPAKKEAAAPAKKENAKVAASTATEATPAKKAPAAKKAAPAKKAAAKTESTPATAPADKK